MIISVWDRMSSLQVHPILASATLSEDMRLRMSALVWTVLTLPLRVGSGVAYVFRVSIFLHTPSQPVLAKMVHLLTEKAEMKSDN